MIRPVQKVIRFTTQNNEQVGIYTEKVVCDCKHIEFKTKRKHTFSLPFEASTAMTTDIMKCVSYLPPIAKHVGGKNEAPDFELQDGRHLSVKSMYSSNKVAPQTIGQPSETVLKSKLNIEFDSFKVYFLSHLGSMLQTYIKFLFSSEVMLAMNYKMGKGYIIEVPDINNTSLNLENYHLKTSKTLETWNESNTIYLVNPLAEDNKLMKISIAEVQVHNHRSCCKFRFNLDNLLTHGLVKGINVTTIELEHKYRIKTVKKQENTTETKSNIECEIERISNLSI